MFNETYRNHMIEQFINVIRGKIVQNRDGKFVLEHPNRKFIGQTSDEVVDSVRRFTENYLGDSRSEDVDHFMSNFFKK